MKTLSEDCENSSKTLSSYAEVNQEKWWNPTFSDTLLLQRNDVVKAGALSEYLLSAFYQL